ncbi:MAG UNVERIFIED_CONTAM: SDR family NAD(P)-dependent oxidoreductase, partial [Thermobifida fusca]
MLTDKRVLVTGAGGGIGREIAVEAARQGAAWVTVADLNPAAAAETAEMVAGVGARAHAVAVDLADSAQVRRMVEEAVAAGGGLDTLVNNAGVLDSAFTDTPTVEELPEGAW